MAKAVINLQKESGGIVKISPVDGIGVTEVTVPESGELATVDYVKNNGDINSVTSFSQISGTNEIVGIELTNNIHDVFGDSSAVATYTLDDNVNDLGGNYNGTATNVTYSAGKYNNSLAWSSTNGKVTTSMPVLLYANSWTVSFWSKWNGTGQASGYYTPFHSGDLALEWANSAIYITLLNGGGTGVYSHTYNNSELISYATDNQWHLFTITHTGNVSNTELYIDGIKRDYGSSGGGSFHRATTTTFGYLATNYSASLSGQLDQIRIFNRALTEDEINTLYIESRVSANAQLNINQGTFIYPKGLGAIGYKKSSDVFTGTIDVSAQTDGWKYVAKDESNNFSFYTDKPTIGKKSATLYLEKGRLHKTVDDIPITPISFLSNKVRIASGVPVELAPSDISKTVSESLEAGSYFGKNAIVAYASIDMTTTPPTILDSHNIASVIRSSNGVGKVILINPTDIDSVTAICGSNSVAGTITATTKNEISFATGATNYAKTSVIVIGGKF